MKFRITQTQIKRKKAKPTKRTGIALIRGMLNNSFEEVEAGMRVSGASEEKE